MRPYSPAFEQIIGIIAETPQYTIGDFLMEFFGSPPRRGHATGRSLSHGKMLGMFIKGSTTFGVGEALRELHRAAGEFRQTEDQDLYVLTPLYHSLKSGYTALTSYAAQQVKHRLLEEQEAATDPHAGLHVFEPRKPGEEEIKLRLSWDTYGATTLADIQTILKQHQPLTFGYISILAHPKRHKEGDEFRYRPPNVVCDIFMLWSSPCHLQHVPDRDGSHLSNQLRTQSSRKAVTNFQWDPILQQRSVTHHP